MDASETLRRARQQGGLTLRALAERAGTSHATLSAYETGRVVPRVDTLERILRAAGFTSDIYLGARVGGSDTERVARGDELREVLELAALFPARHSCHLNLPVFGPKSATGDGGLGDEGNLR